MGILATIMLGMCFLCVTLGIMFPFGTLASNVLLGLAAVYAVAGGFFILVKSP